MTAMKAEIGMNKRFTAFLLAAAWILVLSAGCQQKPARVYRVAYASPKSASMMENPNQAAEEPAGAAGGSMEAGQYPVEAAEASNAANTGGGETAASTAPAAEVTKAVYVPTAEYLTAADVQAMGPASQEYHVDAGDVLQLKIDQLLQLDREEVVVAEVDRLGQIYLPLLNHVAVAGLTCEQIRQELVLRLGKDYIRDPKVDVSIKEYGSKKVMVMGMVRQPGAVALERDNATLLDVITKAGGITAGAGVDVEILRGAYHPGQERDLPGSAGVPSGVFGPATKRELVPVARLLAEDGGTVNPIIYPGDIVNVPLDGDGYIYLSGEVKQPGAKPFRRTLNLLQAMSCAGGPTRNAAEKKCKIIRRTADGGEQVLVANLEDIKKGKEQNIVLAQNDTIVVPGDPVKIFFNGINDLFRRGVFAGVRMEYDAAEDMGIPSDGGYGGY